MLQKLEQSHEAIIGFQAIGDITKEDYQQLVPEVQALVDEYGAIRMLLDMTEFHWEKVSAWGKDLHFGREYHDKIEKMAIVGDKKWEEWLAKLAAPFYAAEARYFHSDAIDTAWQWLGED